MDGMEVCRARENAAPGHSIIMLTAKSEEVDRDGLETRRRLCDKTLLPRELVARRRFHGGERLPGDSFKEVFELGPIRIDMRQHKVTVNGKPVELTPKEFDLLHLLVSHPGRAFSREFLLEHLWGYEFFGDTRTVDVHVRRLRQKIEEDPANPHWLETVRGVGYRMLEEGE